MHVSICIYSTGNFPTFFFAVFLGPSSCVGPFSLQVSEKFTDKVCVYRFKFVRIFVLSSM